MTGIAPAAAHRRAPARSMARKRPCGHRGAPIGHERRCRERAREHGHQRAAAGRPAAEQTRRLRPRACQRAVHAMRHGRHQQQLERDDQYQRHDPVRRERIHQPIRDGGTAGERDPVSASCSTNVPRSPAAQAPCGRTAEHQPDDDRARRGFEHRPRQRADRRQHEPRGHPRCEPGGSARRYQGAGAGSTDGAGPSTSRAAATSPTTRLDVHDASAATTRRSHGALPGHRDDERADRQWREDDRVHEHVHRQEHGHHDRGCQRHRQHEQVDARRTRQPSTRPIHASQPRPIAPRSAPSRALWPSAVAAMALAARPCARPTAGFRADRAQGEFRGDQRHAVQREQRPQHPLQRVRGRRGNARATTPRRR